MYTNQATPLLTTLSVISESITWSVEWIILMFNFRKSFVLKNVTTGNVRYSYLHSAVASRGNVSILLAC